MHFKPVVILASLLVINTVHAASAATTIDDQLLDQMKRDTRKAIIDDLNRRKAIALAGDWSTTSYYGFLRNPSTGGLGRSLHNGKWFAFRADDSSYKYVNIASGPLISGTIIEEGTYEVNGNRLILHRKTESFLPANDDPSGRPGYKDRRNPEDSTLEFNLSGQELVIGKGYYAETFRRDPNSK